MTSIWDEWAGPTASSGPVYGVQWRSWPTPDGGHIDQIAQVIHTLKTNPDSRRIIVSAWNVADLGQDGADAPAAFFQFYVAPEGGRLSCQLYQRSADIFLGVPFNIASFHALLHAHGRAAVRPGPGDFIWTGGDCRIYSNHHDQGGIRSCPGTPRATRLTVPAAAPPASIFDYAFEDFEVRDYDPHPAIAAGRGLRHQGRGAPEP